MAVLRLLNHCKHAMSNSVGWADFKHLEIQLTGFRNAVALVFGVIAHTALVVGLGETVEGLYIVRCSP
jgi:hypothetical protein